MAPRRAEATPLFGRDDDLERLARLFEDERLVTLTGPGGIGKTSLALTLAAKREKAVVVDWSEARDAPAATVALAQAVGARAGGEALAAIDAALAKSPPELLVLDNCEDIVEAAATIVSRILHAVPALRILATSRERLGIAREVVLALEPLATATTTTTTTTTTTPTPTPTPTPTLTPTPDPALAPAVALFVDRARRARASYSFGADAREVSEIVARLEGIPLAIELAAARMAVMDAKSVLERLDAPFALLKSGPRSAPERHRTLRAAIEGSLAGLAAPLRSTLAQCSVFRGGFTLEAAERVVHVAGEDPASTLDRLEALAERSLLRAIAPPGFPSEVRFAFFESIRALAAELLAADPDRDGAAARHRAYFLATGTQWEAKHWHGGLETVKRLALERENLLAARANALADATPDGARDVIRAAIALHPIFAALGPFAANPALLDRARTDGCLAQANPELRARFHLVRGRAEQFAGNGDASRADFEEALTAARAASDPRLEARALVHLATSDRARGHLASARDRFEASLARFEAAGDEAAASVVLSALGALELGSGALDDARRRIARAAAIQRRVGDRATLGMMLIDLGIIEQELGRFADARATFDEARAIHRSVENRRFLGVATGYRANLDLEEGRVAEAREGYRAALDMLGPIGDVRFESLFGAALASIDHDGAAFDRIEARAEGRVEPRFVAAIGLHRARSEWTSARSRGEPDEREALRARIESRRGATAGLERESDDVRFALRLLHRALGTEARPSAAPSPAERVLHVARDAGTFQPPGGATCDLGRRESARRILLALVRKRIDAPGAALSARELVEAGWPGEKMNDAAAKNRLHVTLAKLRELGLRGVLLTEGGGHLLDPELAVVIGRD